MKKPSFLERLTGTAASEDYDRILDKERSFGATDEDGAGEGEDSEDWQPDSSRAGGRTPQEGELSVDMFQTSEAIVIRALVAGVAPSDLDIAITRDMVSIRGVREEVQETHDDNYHNRELFWGSFSRSILLPEEIVIDEAEAQEKHGLLEIRLPKLDKQRSTQLRVKTNVVQK
jgi:HSP20 family protein